MKDVLVVAPHADDESLGCGGTILRHIAEGERVHWLLVTGMTVSHGYTGESVEKRKQEIAAVAKEYSFSSVHELNFIPAALDILSLGDVIAEVSKVVTKIRPEVVYAPYRNDAHSDHAVVYDAVLSSTKSFRYPFVKKVLAYETISETDFGLKPGAAVFRPNYFVAIDDFLARKLDVLSIYQSELGPFPFPRSIEAVEALSKVRGVQCNSRAAEAFMLLKEIV
jgi:LmbE family N-acetylglucosaminyl deacetylase